MATFVNDTFTDTAATALPSHTGETGATWAYNTLNAAAFVISNANRCRPSLVGNGYAYASGVPSSADYEVNATVRKFSSVGTGTNVGITARSSTGVITFYYAHYNDGAAQWQMGKVVAGTNTSLGTAFSQALTIGQDYTLTLRVAGTAISVYVDGVLRIGPTTDSAISAVGLAGIKCAGSTTTASDSTGYHLDNFNVTDVPTAPARTAQPSIAPTTNVHASDVLTRTAGTYTGFPTPSITGQWKLDAVDISGQTASTYTVQAGDVGHDVTYAETATNASGSATGLSNAVTIAATSTGASKNLLLLGVG